MNEYLLAGLLVVLIGVVVVIIILMLANMDAFFTLVRQGTTKFIDMGDSLGAILPNVGGYRLSSVEDLDGRRWLIRDEDKTRQREAFCATCLPGTGWLQWLLWKRFGVRFIGLFWPHTHVHTFDIRSKKRIKERSEVGDDAPLRSRVEDAHETLEEGQAPKPKSTKVNSLRFLVPRPIFMEGVELPGDNALVNILLMPTFRQVIPALPVYYLNGDFFGPLDGAIEAAMTDFVARHRVAVYKDGERKGEFAHDTFHPQTGDSDGNKDDAYKALYEPCPLTYAHWLKLGKEGEDSPVERQFRHLNFSKAYLEKLQNDATKKELYDYIDDHLVHDNPAVFTSSLPSVIPSGIVPRFGLALVSFRLVEWEAHKQTDELGRALREKQVKFHQAEGVREEAKGVRDATMARADGEFQRFERLMKALTDARVHPDQASEVVRTMLRTENIRDSKVTTYVEGGASASVLVNPPPAGAGGTTTPPPAGTP